LTPLIWVAVELTMIPPQRRLIARRVDRLKILAGIGLIGGVSGGVVWLLLFDGWTRLRLNAATLLLKFNYLDSPTLDVYYRMTTKALAFVVGKIFWPVDLAPEYTFSVPSSFLDPWILAALLLVGVYLFGGLWLWRYRQPWWVFWLWVGIFWLPVLNFYPLTWYPVADRYMYTPLMGMIALLILASAELAGRSRLRLIIPALLMTALMTNTWLSWRQVDVWQSDLSLWTHVSQVNPRSTTAFINLSSRAINVEGDFELGLGYAKQAIALNPRHPGAHKNYAVALERLERYPEAAREYQLAYQLFRDKSHPLARELRLILARNYKIFLP